MRAARFAFWLLPFAVACATGDGMQEKLRDATRGYSRAIRWGDFDRAVVYMPTSSADAYLVNSSEIEDEVVVLDYELARLQLDKQAGTASSRVTVSWHTHTRLIVEETTVDSVWQWHDGDWVLVDERRVDGEPLDLFADGELGDGEHPYLPGLELYRKQHGIEKDAKEKRRRSIHRSGTTASR